MSNDRRTNESFKMFEDNELRDERALSQVKKFKPLIPQFRPNSTYITQFMIIMVLSGFQIGYAMMCINRIEEFMQIKFDWPNESEATYISILTGVGIVGLAFGSLTSGYLMKDGRKRCMLIATAIGVIGVSIEMIDNFWVIAVGRLIYGYSCGIYAPCIGRYIEEVLPVHLLPTLFPIYTCGMAASAILVMMAAIILPNISN
jgi:MFS family permease